MLQFLASPLRNLVAGFVFVLGIGALPVSACVAASGIVTEGASASPVTPASWLVADGASPSPRNSPDAPICDSRRHAGQTNTNRARSPLVEQALPQEAM